MNRFLEDSESDGRNFIKEELKILDPDLIITANLWDRTLEEVIVQNSDGGSDCVTALNTIEINNKPIKIVDLI